jgi:hypothetical protein
MQDITDATPELPLRPEAPIPVMRPVPRRIPKKKIHTFPAARPTLVVSPVGAGRLFKGSAAGGVAPALDDQKHHMGSRSVPSSSGSTLENEVLPRSLPAKTAAFGRRKAELESTADLAQTCGVTPW